MTTQDFVQLSHAIEPCRRAGAQRSDGTISTMTRGRIVDGLVLLMLLALMAWYVIHIGAHTVR